MKVIVKTTTLQRNQCFNLGSVPTKWRWPDSLKHCGHLNNTNNLGSVPTKWRWPDSLQHCGHLNNTNNLGSVPTKWRWPDSLQHCGHLNNTNNLGSVPTKWRWSDSLQHCGHLNNTNNPLLSTKCIFPDQTNLHAFFLDLLLPHPLQPPFNFQCQSLMPFSRHDLTNAECCQ